MSTWRQFLPVHPVWVTAWTTIYLIIIIAGIFAPFAPWLTYIKLLSIFSCFLFAAYYSRRDPLLVLALFFTFCSDCILAINNLSVAGVLLFAVVQITHFLRLSRNTTYVKYYFFFILAILALIIFLPREYSLVICGSAYALTLLANIFLSWRWHRLAPSNASTSALIGFVLFAACDLHVVASYSCVIGILPFEIKGFADYMAWFFYFPSQIALAHSAQTVIK